MAHTARLCAHLLEAKAMRGCRDTVGPRNMLGALRMPRVRLPGRGPAPSPFMLARVLMSVLWLAASSWSLSAAAQQTQPETAPIVQPGAPGTPSKVLPPSTTAHAPQTTPADIDFMQGMIMHHSQAVVMTALIPSHTQNPEIRTLGARISRSQSDEMNFMKRWLVARGESISMSMPGMPDMDRKGNPMHAMPGMLTPQQMEALRNANGAQFDHLFLEGMIQHHNGALVMVQQLFDTPGAGEDADLFDFATDADNTQRAEIRIMQGMLEEKR